MGAIQREHHNDAVSLFIQPFSGGGLRSMMRIRADVHPPEGRQRTPRIEIFFHGSAYAGQGGRMSVSHARTWTSALDTLIAEAEKVAEEMRSKTRARTDD